VTDFDALKAIAEGSTLLSNSDKALIDRYANAGGDRSKLTAAELAQLDEALAREPKAAMFEPIQTIAEKVAPTVAQLPAATKEIAKEAAKNAMKDALKKIANVPKSIGKSLKKVFCFDGNTLIMMADGSEKPINEIELGDRVYKGGEVDSIRHSIKNPNDKYNYHNIIVTGFHAVKENGIWKRIKDCKEAYPYYLEGDVYSICTTNHRMWIKGIEFADEIETDNYENLTIDESLDELNRSGLTIEYSEVK
jgi:hypothetical protein